MKNFQEKEIKDLSKIAGGMDPIRINIEIHCTIDLRAAFDFNRGTRVRDKEPESAGLRTQLAAVSELRS